MATNYRDVNALAKNPAEARRCATVLLALANSEWSDWELDFLDGISQRKFELSSRQAEILVELRDGAGWFTKAGGILLAALVKKCWQARLDLSSDERIEFIERLYESGATSFRRRTALYIWSCAIELGEVEPYAPCDLK